MSSITPTVGRKVWFYYDNNQVEPLDATIIKVVNSGPAALVNLDAVNPINGHHFFVAAVRVGDESTTEPHYRWMPYQMGQAAKTEATVLSAHTPVLDTDKLGWTIQALGIEQPNVETVAAMLEARGIAKARTRGIEQPTDDAAVEQQLQALGKTAPRITPIDVEANILEEHYCTAYEAAEVAQFHKAMSGTGPMDPPKPHPSLALFTICTLVLKNGFVVTGDSACASPENFNVEVGQRLARLKAIDKVWPLLGYELRSKLAAEAAQPVSAGLTD